MTKLLEFNPNKTKSSVLKDILADDTDLCFTPDMPKLRYAKTIPVFVWDDLSFYRGFSSLLGMDDKDHTTSWSIAYTKDKLLPFFQDVADCATPVRNVLPDSPSWNMSLKDKPNNIGEKRQVKGRIENLSLFGIRALDTMYANTISHVRRLTTCVLPNGEEVKAWVYSMPTHVFTKYDPHGGTYELVKGFKPATCNIAKMNDSKEYYMPKIPMPIAPSNMSYSK